MIYSIIVGIILGYSKAAPYVAFPILVGLITVKGISEILLKKNLITGSPSPYSLYKGKLQTSGGRTGKDWIGYLVQTNLFGGALGLIAYGVFYLVF